MSECFFKSKNEGNKCQLYQNSNKKIIFIVNKYILLVAWVDVLEAAAFHRRNVQIYCLFPDPVDRQGHPDSVQQTGQGLPHDVSSLLPGHGWHYVGLYHQPAEHVIHIIHSIK